MRLDDLGSYVRVVQACAGELRGLYARLEGIASTPAAHVTAAPAVAAAELAEPLEAPSYGFHGSPAPATAPRLPSVVGGNDAAAREYARSLVRLVAQLYELERAFTVCARVVRKLRERFEGEACSGCGQKWAACAELELEDCCPLCTHGRAPRTLTTVARPSPPTDTDAVRAADPSSTTRGRSRGFRSSSSR